MSAAMVKSHNLVNYTLMITGVDAKSGVIVGFRHVPAGTLSGLLDHPKSVTWVRGCGWLVEDLGERIRVPIWMGMRAGGRVGGSWG